MVPGFPGPKPFRSGTPRPKSIFLLGVLGQGLLDPVIKMPYFVAFNEKNVYISYLNRWFRGRAVCALDYEPTPGSIPGSGGTTNWL